MTELHPPLTGYGSFHPKMMLLFYVNFCRVVVSSANLVGATLLEIVANLVDRASDGRFGVSIT